MISHQTDDPAALSRRAIAMVVIAMFCISINDMTIKWFSGAYPLHQMVLLRSVLALPITLLILQREGSWRALVPRRPCLQALRALLLVFANLTYFAALSVLPLGTATALFFVAPLVITVLSVPVLGETVGPRRLGAVVVGFLGVVVIMVRPDETVSAPAWAFALPVVAAVAYGGMQLLTRALAGSAPASAMAFYIQMAFILVGLAFWAVAGDGRFAVGSEDPTVTFLLRAWVWPAGQDWPVFILIGGLAGVIGYTLSQAYRIGDAATVAPYEYVALPMALIWGWVIWGEVPDWRTGAGIVMILGAGVYVFLRERVRQGPPPRPLRRM